MARDATRQSESGTSNSLPHLVTIVGRGVPSNYELAVDGELEMDGSRPREEGVIISGGVAEGSVASGVQRFRFSGEQIHVHAVDWNGIEASASPSTPTVHVTYDADFR